MNMKLAFITSIAAFGLLGSTAVAGDNRFDGIWVGTESVMMQEFHGFQRSEPFAQKRPAKIVIAQGGTLLGVLEGYGPGRYNDVKRVGNMIVFQAGVRLGQLSLSADGQTMVEKGRVQGSLIMGGGQREGALSGHQQNYQSHDIPGLAKSTTEVTGTFRRQK
ncbi:MAG TPA: hypothetical protein VKS98_04160 [Chthoniobacterales bacterium]|nr:hypothetical protein [Chthoniobacterales bacterium]